jgi:O-antigen ligase
MNPASLVFELIAVAFATYAAIRWRRALLMSLPFLVTLNGVPLKVGGVSVKLDQLAACLLLIPLLAAAIAGTRRIRLDTTSWLLVALLIANVVSSAINSPVPAYSIKQCLNLASAWAIYILLINYLDAIELEAFLKRVVQAAVAASAIGIMAFVLASSGLDVIGAEVSKSAAENLTTAYGSYGTMVEPNIFGSFAAANLVLATVLFIAGARRERSGVSRRLLRWAIALTAVGVLLSFTRGAWLGAAMGLLCVVVLGSRTRTFRIRMNQMGRPLVASIALMAVLFVLPGDVGTLLRFKVVNLVNPGSQTAIVRLFQYSLALQQTAQHPVLGFGTFSFAALAAEGSDFQQYENWRNLWIGNYLLLALHDTGVIGLGLTVGVLFTVLKHASRVLAATDAAVREHAIVIVALVGAVVTLLVAFLTTSGFSLGYSWLILGLLGAYCHQAQRTRATPATDSEALLATVSDENAVPSGAE